MLKKFQFGLIKNQSIGHLIINNLILFKNNKNINYFFFYCSKESSSPAAEYLIINHLKNKNIVCINLNIFFIKIVRKILFLLKFLNLNFLIFDLEHIHRSNKYLKYGSHFQFFSNNSSTFTFENFPKNKFEYFNEYKNKIIKNSKYICLFYRSSYFYNEKVENVRNSSFSNLIPSIEYLISLGYYVVMLGDYEKNSINYYNSKFISLPKNLKYNSWLDFFFIKYATYFVTSNSGFSNLQFLVNTPMLVLNSMPIGLRIPYKKSFYILKKIKKNNKIVDYNKIQKSLLLSEKKKSFSDLGYEIIENSSNEILNAVKDMISNNAADEIIYKNLIPVVYGSDIKLCQSFLKDYINELKE